MISSLEKYAYPQFDARLYDLNQLPKVLSLDLMAQYRLLPLLQYENILHVAITDPYNAKAIEVLQSHVDMQLHILIINDDEFDDLIEQYSKLTSAFEKIEIPDVLKPIALPQNHTALLSHEEPLIEFVDHLLEHAVQVGASDVHIEPYERFTRMRLRQDGLLRHALEIPKDLSDRIIIRLKLIAELDITERRIPQDGHFQIKVNENKINIRISTCPILSGEKIVLRILDSNKMIYDLNDLGLTASQVKLFRQKLQHHQGLILVTGPTGSGKTVTLYSALAYLNCEEKNISSVENPVEIPCEGVNQINIHPKIGLTFANVLRNLLRQDPDVIMIGEIRDEETARIAMQAALTGHLVLATLHTNNAKDTLSRLKNFGIPEYEILNGVSLIIAQCLIRKLCGHCKVIAENYDERYRHIFQKDTVYEPRYCHHCYHGYKGRTGIYELVHSFQSTTNNDAEEMQTIAYDKVKSGITSLAEILSVFRL